MTRAPMWACKSFIPLALEKRGVEGFSLDVRSEAVGGIPFPPGAGHWAGQRLRTCRRSASEVELMPVVCVSSFT